MTQASGTPGCDGSEQDSDSGSAKNPITDIAGFITRHMTCETCGTPFAQSSKVSVECIVDDRVLLSITCACGHTQVVTAYIRPHYQTLHDRGILVPSAVTCEDVDHWADFSSDFHGDMVDLLMSD